MHDWRDAMRIDNVNVYNLGEAVVASGLPMMAEFDGSVFDRETKHVEERHFKRCGKLCRLGSPHCNFLTGILVTFNITATQAFFLQAHRYHWWQVVSSQSKMHRLEQMLQIQMKHDEPVLFHPATSQMVAFEPMYRKEMLKDECTVEDMVYNVPMGLMTTEHVSTNYQQLRNIYAQRRDHRLREWRDFCEWIETLPCADVFIQCGKDAKKEENA